MSVIITPQSMRSSLWSKATGPRSMESGQFLHVKLAGSREGDAAPLLAGPRFTHIVADPLEVGYFGLATDSDCVYALSLKTNLISLVCCLEGKVTAMVFSGTSRRHLLCATTQGSVVWVHTDTCRVVHVTHQTPHGGAILQLAASAGSLGIAASISLHTLAVWDTHALECRENSDVHVACAHAPVTSRKTLTLKVNFPRSFSAVSVLNGNGGNSSRSPCVVLTAEADGRVTTWSVGPLKPMRCVDLSPLRTSSLAVCGELVIAAGISSGPLLACVNHRLEGGSTVQVPAVSAVDGIKTISSIDDALVIVETVCGRGATFIQVKDFTVAFSVPTPPPDEPVTCDAGTLLGFVASGAAFGAFLFSKSLVLFHLPTARQHFLRQLKREEKVSPLALLLTPGGTQAGAKKRATSRNVSPARRPVASTAPAARRVQSPGQAVVHRTAGRPPSDPISTGPSKTVYSFVERVGESSTPAPVPATETADLHSIPLHRKPLVIRDGIVSNWVKVNLLSSSVAGAQTSMRGGRKRGSLTSGLAPKKTLSFVGDLPVDSTTVLQNETIHLHSFLDADSRQFNLDKLRGLLLRFGVYPGKYRPYIWRFLLQLPSKRLTAPVFAYLSTCQSNGASDGMDTRANESGLHPAVPHLMRPFPLARSSTRTALEKALSVLAWNASVFSVADFLPGIVFPFVQVYGSDIQSAVEVSLAFLLNWGQEYFAFYPHFPVALNDFLVQLLEVEDYDLLAHLGRVGVSPEVWGWDVIKPLYTEVLTGPEWLQVMDHAFTNLPLWLYVFHICWLKHIRGVLLQLPDHHQIQTALRSVIPITANHVIQETYRLLSRLLAGETSLDATQLPYTEFHTFRNIGSYPTAFRCDEVVVHRKISDLHEVWHQRSRAQAAQWRVLAAHHNVASDDCLEEADIRCEHAAFAARVAAFDESWQQQVQLESERQRLAEIEHGVRLGVLQEQLQQAQRLEDLSSERVVASLDMEQTALERRREMLKWNVSRRLIEQDYERAENEVRMRAHGLLATAAVVHAAGAGAVPAEPLASCEWLGRGGRSTPGTVVDRHNRSSRPQTGNGSPTREDKLQQRHRPAQSSPPSCAATSTPSRSSTDLSTVEKLRPHDVAANPGARHVAALPSGYSHGTSAKSTNWTDIASNHSTAAFSDPHIDDSESTDSERPPRPLTRHPLPSMRVSRTEDDQTISHCSDSTDEAHGF